ncbi:MAG: hypothetical protein ABJB85_07940 [Nitrososphaerota archaeon]
MNNINDSHTKAKAVGYVSIINSHEGIIQDMQNTGLAIDFCFRCIADLSEYYYQRKRIKYRMVGNVPLPDSHGYSMTRFEK